MLRQYVHQFGQKLVRRRRLGPREASDRCTASSPEHPRPDCPGVGGTLGNGMYILVGEVSAHEAGPADRHLLLAGRSAYSFIRALLCRVGSPGTMLRLCVSLQLHHHGSAVRLHWLNLILSYVMGDDGVGKGVGLQIRNSEEVLSLINLGKLCCQPCGLMGYCGRKKPTSSFYLDQPRFL